MFQNQVLQLLPHSDIQGRSFILWLKREVSIPSNWVPRWIWREHILCLFCSCLTSVTGRCIFFCLGVSFWHYWNTLLVIEGLFDFHICVYEQSISHLLLYFSISTKVFILNQKSLNLLLWFRTRWHDKNIGSFLPMIMDSEWNCLYQEI